MALIDIDDEFLELFFNITNTKRPQDIDVVELKKQLVNIVELLKTLNDNAKKPILSKALGTAIEPEANNGPAILIVDDLGVIT